MAKLFFTNTKLTTIILMLQIFCTNPTLALPNGFIYLRDIDPTIIENLRYYSGENFIGRRVDGYKSNKVILTKEAAKSLSKVQKELLSNGYSLIVYDAYRPQKAVDQFVKWSEDSADQINKNKYYPDVAKNDVFKLGYVAEKSGHTRGSTVDVTMIRSDSALKEITIHNRKLLDGNLAPYLEDGTVDMGTSFDLFGVASHHDSKLIEKKYLDLRNYLRTVMKENGFKEYQEEWWHYTLENEPFLEIYFDFDIE
ncbi:MAG: M15 family metallopeptidase [Janthinobacterium lividum]